MGFEEENKITCPQCGKSVSAEYEFCGFCRASLSGSTNISSIEPVGSTTPAPSIPPYVRKFSVLERFTKLLFSPKEAMEDIGLAPDYGGVAIIFLLWTIISAIGVFLALPKIQFIGPYADQIYSMLVPTTIGAIVFVPIFLAIRWWIKSYLIQHGCNSKSWNFETAASVTGYAYLPNVIFGLIGVIVMWVIMPSIVINTTNLEAALIRLQTFSSQTIWISVGVSTILSLIALFWKSYLGSWGAYSGTRRSCEQESAFGTFLMIGFLGLAIDFVISFF